MNAFADIANSLRAAGMGHAADVADRWANECMAQGCAEQASHILSHGRYCDACFAKMAPAPDPRDAQSWMPPELRATKNDD